MTNIVYNAENAWADFDAAGQVMAQYLFGNRIDQILAQYRSNEGTSWHFESLLHTIRDIINAQGQHLNHIAYSAFGQPVHQMDLSYGSRYMFAAREYSLQLDVHALRARYLDSQTGRFLSTDPIHFDGADTNLFRYVGNSPLGAIDPTGTSIVGTTCLVLGVLIPAATVLAATFAPIPLQY